MELRDKTWRSTKEDIKEYLKKLIQENLIGVGAGSNISLDAEFDELEVSSSPSIAARRGEAHYSDGDSDLDSTAITTVPVPPGGYGSKKTPSSVGNALKVKTGLRSLFEVSATSAAPIS